eukprot:762933-Hanusia_phi.AAC.3
MAMATLNSLGLQVLFTPLLVDEQTAGTFHPERAHLRLLSLGSVLVREGKAETRAGQGGLQRRLEEDGSMDHAAAG